MAHAVCPPVRLLCRRPTDGDQMRAVGFYSLFETLDSIRADRQQVQGCFTGQNWTDDFSINGYDYFLTLIEQIYLKSIYRYKEQPKEESSILVTDDLVCYSGGEA